MSRPAKVRLQNLTDIHTGRHTERVKHDLNRSSILQIWHVLVRKNASDYALVAMTSRHLVANRKLALHGDVNLHQLDHARRKLIALLQLRDFLVDDLAQHVDLPRGHLLDFVDLLVYTRIFVVVLDALQVARRDALDGFAIKNPAFG